MPVSPPGLLPEQTARIYSLLTYLKTPEPHQVDGPEEAKGKWRAANPAALGGPVDALKQFTETCLLAASGIARQGVPVSVGTGVSIPPPRWGEGCTTKWFERAVSILGH